MARVSVHLGMRLGAAVGLVAGLIIGAVHGWNDPVGAEMGAATAGIFLGSAGLLAGCVIANVINVLLYLSEPGKVPSSGPEADYHELPVSPRAP